MWPSKTMSKSKALFLWLFLSLLSLDQLVKLWARVAAEGVEGRSIFPLWPGVFELKLVYNQGVAFGLLEGKGFWMFPIALAMAGFAAWHTWKHPDAPKIVHITTATLAAGAIGNMIDRVVAQKVTDMFWFRLINFPVFNIADVCITFAGVMLVISALADLFRPKGEEPGPVLSSDPSPTESETQV